MTKYLLTTIMFFLGCDTSINASKGEITTKFFLKNNQSDETTRFGFGQDINFNYSIENRTENSYSYLKQDTGPLVTFEVYKKDSLIGTSLDGLAFIPVIAEDILKAGETLQRSIIGSRLRYISRCRLESILPKQDRNLNFVT